MKDAIADLSYHKNTEESVREEKAKEKEETKYDDEDEDVNKFKSDYDYSYAPNVENTPTKLHDTIKSSFLDLYVENENVKVETN